MSHHIYIPILISTLLSFTSGRSVFNESTPSILLLPSSVVVGEMSGACPSPDPSLNYRPIIGIVTHPGDGASGRLSNATNASYIAASYVKFVESAGARVIPIIYNEPIEIIQKKLNLVNGVLFTGGWSKTGLYFDVIEEVFNQVLKKNDAGEHFPLLAICLGFELVTMIVSKNNNILEAFSASDQASTLQFMNNINIEETMFQRFPSELVAKLSTECLVMQNHKKNAFEWGSSVIPHSDNAIQVTQHVANYFVSEARKSFNRPPNDEVLKTLIYNYSPTYCGTAGKGYDEVYIFTENEKMARL
ncbi:gamma-glutamyl hydrolase 2-like protein [Tanacetum coccineum]|uniref:folate gamma-glutamyl hydrolase n=1 Tax=Tanacetum coccineum TaxID=301880 RepID=A0ABQ5EY70_9ASTR